jgi:hypothetical protein
VVVDVDGRAAFELGGGSETPTRVVPSEDECFRVGRGFDVGRDCLVVAGACDGWQSPSSRWDWQPPSEPPPNASDTPGAMTARAIAAALASARARHGARCGARWVTGDVLGGSNRIGSVARGASQNLGFGPIYHLYV